MVATASSLISIRIHFYTILSNFDFTLISVLYMRQEELGINIDKAL